MFTSAISRPDAWKYIAVILGRCYASAKMLEVQAVLAHHKSAAPGLVPVSRETMQQMRQAVHNTRLLDALNRNRKWARRRLCDRLAPMLSEGVVIVVVPSHDPWIVETPIRSLAQEAATLIHGTDGTGCLVRHTKIKRIVFGGPSNRALHRRTIQVENPEIFRGRHVLLLDDIAKSGSSLLTCRDLLYHTGAATVQAAALGLVIGVGYEGDGLPEAGNPRAIPGMYGRVDQDRTYLDNFFQVTLNHRTLAAMNEQPTAELEPIPGDTYPLRAELKALGAVWNPAERDWRIAPDKLPLASALVEHQALIPPKGLPTDADGEVIDPFEQDDTPRVVALEKQDGATYDQKDALRAVGARWEKAQRSWVIREERAPYARAVLRDIAGSPPAPARSAPPKPAPPKAPMPTNEVEADLPTDTPALVPPRPKASPAAPPASPVVRETAAEYRTPDVAAPPAPRPTTGERMRLGGLWINHDKDGNSYLVGKLSPTVKILIYKNKFKTTDAHPSHVIYLAPVEQAETRRPGASPPNPAEDSEDADANNL